MITIRVLYFVIALALFTVVLLAVGLYYFVRAQRRKKYPYGKWEDILKRLTIVDRDSIEMIARDFAVESGRAGPQAVGPDLDPSEIWDLVGGMRGLEELEKNCEALVDLVFYVQQWYPEALLLAEQMRQSTREIQWHVARLKSAEKAGHLKDWFPEAAQRVVVQYLSMTRKVLALYEQGGYPGFAELQRAL